MPTKTTTPRWLTILLWSFAAAAILLWLLSLTVSRPTLFPAGPTYEDIIVYKGRFTLYHTAKFFTSRAYSAFAYPAGSAPIYEAFYSTSSPLNTYIYVSYGAILAGLFAALAFLRKQNAASFFFPLLFLSFPMIFLVQRANIEIVLWVLVAVGLVLYRRGWAIPAAMVFGIVAATKLYPILLLGLFLKRKRDLPAFVIGILSAMVAMAAAIAYTGPTFLIAAKGFFTGVNRFQDHYVDVVSKVEVMFDHCLFSPFKYYAYSHHISPAPWKSLYFLIAAALALVLFLRVRTMPFLNRVLFLVTAMVCLPPVSFTYTLVHLYVPLLFLLAAMAGFRSNPPVTAIFALMLLCFVMLPLMGLSALSPTLPTGPMQSIALLCVLLLCAMQPWPEASIAADTV